MSESPIPNAKHAVATLRDFKAFDQALGQQGVSGALKFLEQQFRERQQYPQLFEVLKMGCRNRLGLPLIHDSSTAQQLNEASQRQLEEGLLEACLEVGLLLWEQGNLEQGWRYLQAVGNRAEIANALQRVPVDEENLDFLIEIAMNQGIAPVFGYQLLLQKYGTCNAITAFDMQAVHLDHLSRLRLAQALLHHLYGELRGNIIHWLQQQRAAANLSAPHAEIVTQGLLSDLIAANPLASAQHGHHIDATHLASVVRIARLVCEPSDIRIALELTNYGLELHSDFHYPGLPPFEETYLDHQKFYQAQLRIEVEAGLKHFRDKCDTVPTDRFGAIAFETLADLLIRLGRRDDAIKLLTEHVWGKLQSTGHIGNVFTIPQTAGEQARLQNYFRSQLDLLSFAVSRVHSG
jgi:hypothetical protein